MTTRKPPKTPKLYKQLNWEQRESEKKLNHIDDLIRVNLNVSERNFPSQNVLRL